MKLTRNQIQSRKEQAVRFVRNLLDDPDRAEEIAEESLESYAERRGFEISNPRRMFMARRRKTVAELESEVEDLQEQVDDLEGENESLRDQIDQATEILSPEEEEDGEDGEDDDLGED